MVHLTVETAQGEVPRAAPRVYAPAMTQRTSQLVDNNTTPADAPDGGKGAPGLKLNLHQDYESSRNGLAKEGRYNDDGDRRRQGQVPRGASRNETNLKGSRNVGWGRDVPDPRAPRTSRGDPRPLRTEARSSRPPADRPQLRRDWPQKDRRTHPSDRTRGYREEGRDHRSSRDDVRDSRGYRDDVRDGRVSSRDDLRDRRVPRDARGYRKEPRDSRTNRDEPRDSRGLRDDPRDIRSSRDEDRESRSARDDPREIRSSRDELRDTRGARDDPRDIRSSRDDPRDRRSPRDEPREPRAQRDEPRDSSRGLREEDRESPRGVREEERESPRGIREEERESPRGLREEERESPRGLREEERESPRGIREEERESPRGLREEERESPRGIREEERESPRGIREEERESPRGIREEARDSPRGFREEARDSPRGFREEARDSPRGFREETRDSPRALREEARDVPRDLREDPRDVPRRYGRDDPRDRRDPRRTRSYIDPRDVLDSREARERRTKEAGDSRDDRGPLRHDPVGEENGDDVFASGEGPPPPSGSRRMHRGRADSVTSQMSSTSHMSHVSYASTRPPIDPRRRPPSRKGYDYYGDRYGQPEQYDQYSSYYYHYYYPYYQEYWRHHMKNIGHNYPKSIGDDRTSIHSGRSSVNDELKKSMSSQFLQDFHGASYIGGNEPSAIYPEHNFSQLKPYGSGEISSVPSVAGDTTEPSQRLTPVKFGRPHVTAHFTTTGHVLVVPPNDPREGEKARVELRDIQKILAGNQETAKEIRELSSYPGPLTPEDTHKDLVMEFCEQRAAEAARDKMSVDQDSRVLIWEYLALLVKHNGKLCGTDIAKLLLKGQDSDSAQLAPHSNNTNAHNYEENQALGSSDSSPDEGIYIPPQSNGQPPPKDEARTLKIFKEYVCLGRKKEAVDFAMREGLWSYALVLSDQMDSHTHTRVKTAFFNSIDITDILQTLFQLMSGKRPEITKSYSVDTWGEWKSHLAVMVSNPTGHPDRDRAAIIALGDTLASKGLLYAAHFCYLISQAPWGYFSNKTSKIVLIGSSHNKSFQEFASNEAIQCTEIYEYAKSLDSANVYLEAFQSYKLIYALRLAEYGYPAEALRYCKVISQAVCKNVSNYQLEFVSQVYELASRLKYHDLHYQMHSGELSEMPDPDWLVTLYSVVNNLMYQSMAAASAATEETNQNASASINNYVETTQAEVVTQETQYDPAYANVQSPPEADQAPYIMPDSSDQSSMTAQNSGYCADQWASYDATDAGSQVPAAYSYNQHDDLHDTQTTAPDVAAHEGQTTPEPVPMSAPMQNTLPQSDQGYLPQQPWLPAHPQTPPSEAPAMNNPPSVMTPPLQSSSPSIVPPMPPHHQTSPVSMLPPMPQQSPPQNEPYSSSSVQENHRSEEEREYWELMSVKKTASSPKEEKTTEKEEDAGKGNEDSKDSNKKSGFLSSLFGWKKSTQAILPDDKDPSIVWDDKNKKWVSKDGSTEESAPPPPPPKSMPTMGAMGVPPPIASLRSGPRKSRYVNPVGSSGSTPNNVAPPSASPMMPPNNAAPQSASPMMPPMGVGGPGMMMPSPMVPSPAAPESQEADPAEESEHPGQLPQTDGNQGRTRYCSESSIDLEDEAIHDAAQGTSSNGGESVPMMTPTASGQPMFFNPAQFQPSANTNSTQQRRPGPGRRTYPRR